MKEDRKNIVPKTAATLVHRYDGKVRPTISGPLAVYIRDLLATGLYGATPSAVARELVRQGIIRAIPHIIKPRDFSKPSLFPPRQERIDDLEGAA